MHYVEQGDASRRKQRDNDGQVSDVPAYMDTEEV